MGITHTFIHIILNGKNELVNIHNYITLIFERFPLFFAEKRYKLINFAPKLRIVDKIHYRLIINKKESTSIVNK